MATLRAALIRAVLFLVLIGLPAVVFDWVYWRAPLPQALVQPLEASFRLTAACFVAALVELLYPRRFAPLVVYFAALVTYGLGFVEAAYLKGVVVNREPSAGTVALAELANAGWERPRYYICLLALVSTPYAATCFGRLRKQSLAATTLGSAGITLGSALVIFEPFRLEVGRVDSFYICLRTILVALLLPFVAAVAEKRSRRAE